MARTGRPKLTDPSVEWKIMVRGSLAARVSLLLLDPVSGHIEVGARSKLINQLLAEWVEKQQLSGGTS